jgi:hypothetical protein
MSANSYLEKIRQQAINALQETPKSYNNDAEWSPTETPTKVRFLELPEVSGKLNFPYITHTHHYLKGGREDGKDIKLFVPKKVIKNGVEVEDPIDAFVRKLYDTKVESERKVASEFKRKRAFYFNALVYEDGINPQYKVIIDTSGEGKLARRICSVMGLPFCKDIDDKWFPDKDFSFDPDKPYYDLINASNGYDFKIKKSVTGKDPWNFDYNESFPITNKGARPLTEAELNMTRNAKDLYSYVAYENDYFKVEEYLNRAISRLGGEIEQRVESPKYNVPNVKKAVPTITPTHVEEELDEEDLRAQLLD